MVGLRGYPVKYAQTGGTGPAGVVTSDAGQVACVGSYSVKWRPAPFEVSSIDITTNNNLDTGGGKIDLIGQAAQILTTVVESI